MSPHARSGTPPEWMLRVSRAQVWSGGLLLFLSASSRPAWRAGPCPFTLAPKLVGAPRASVASRYGDTDNAVDRSDTRRPFRRAEVSAPVLASIGGSRVFARPRNATEASTTSAAAKRDKHPIRLHLVLAGRERFGCGSRRRRRRPRESRHEPVADDRRAGGAGVRVLAEPGRDRSTAPAGSRYERLEPVAPATRPRAAVAVP
jgi:hypothetical protein